MSRLLTYLYENALVVAVPLRSRTLFAYFSLVYPLILLFNIRFGANEQVKRPTRPKEFQCKCNRQTVHLAMENR